MKIALVVIVKNEIASLLEWIAYHKAVGIEDFIIIDNHSTDGTWELLKKLQRRGAVKALRFKTLAGQAPQVDAYQYAVSGMGKKYDAVGVIDADEYLVPMDGANSVVPILEKLFSNAGVSAVALNWACFGSGGSVFKEEGLVPERFLKRSDEDFFVNKHYKSIIRTSSFVRFMNPHQALLSEGDYVMADGELLVPNEKIPSGLSQGVNWSGLRINHYVVKSLEEFLVRKSRVGSAAQIGKIKHKGFFGGHDRNDVEDDSILRFMPETHRIFESLNQSLSSKMLFERVPGWASRIWGNVELGFFWVRRAFLYRNIEKKKNFLNRKKI